MTPLAHISAPTASKAGLAMLAVPAVSCVGKASWCMRSDSRNAEPRQSQRGFTGHGSELGRPNRLSYPGTTASRILRQEYLIATV